MRRIPGWPEDELSRTLVKFQTPYFNPHCDGGVFKERRLSDDFIANKGMVPILCGMCHVVSFI